LTAADLKLAAPREFDLFVGSIRSFEERCGGELRAAGPNVIFTAQGKAQLVSQLRQKLETCLEIKNKRT
jgi:hypothetical protein